MNGVEHVPIPIPYLGSVNVWLLRGAPLTLDARMDTQSILYRTLWLFAATFLAVAAAFGAAIWWVMRRGAEPPPQPARAPR